MFFKHIHAKLDELLRRQVLILDQRPDFMEEVDKVHDRLLSIERQLKGMQPQVTKDVQDKLAENTSRLNQMMNEYKGLVSIARAGLPARKGRPKKIEEA